MSKRGKIIGIISPKGGVGKTVTSSNLAIALSKVFDKKILTVDTNVTTASLGFHFDIVYPQNAIHNILRKNFPIDQILHKYNENLDIIPASIVIQKEDRNIITMHKNVGKIVSNYSNLLKKMSNGYDIILLDAAGGFGVEALATMEVADSVILVTNPEYPAILATAKSVEYARLLNIHIEGVLLTKVHGKRYELTKERIEDALKLKVIGEIPFDNNVHKAIAFKMPIMLFRPYSKASIAYKKLASSILNEKYEPKMMERFRSAIKM